MPYIHHFNNMEIFREDCIVVRRYNPFDGDTYSTTFDSTAFSKDTMESFKAGKIFVQDAFPNFPPDIREWLMTGITLDYWNKTFERKD